MYHTSNGKVSVVLEVILGEEKIQTKCVNECTQTHTHTRINDVMPTSLRCHGKRRVRLFKKGGAALDEGLYRGRINVDSLPCAGQSDLCSGAPNVEALSDVSQLQWTQNQYLGSLGH